MVAAKTGWLIRRQLDAGAESIFYSAIAAGDIAVEDLTAADWQRVAELITTYADLELDAADASIVALAERFNLVAIATLDIRDFSVVKPAHCEALTLTPYHAGNTANGKPGLASGTNSQHAPPKTPILKPIQRLGRPLRRPS
jgi:hypothetical protein